MHRPRLTAAALFILAATVAGCSSTPEEQLISQFFRASRMRDNTTLANISMVSFAPTDRGIVQSFDIETISEQARRPMRARSLGQALMEAEATDQEFSDRKQAYQDENLEAIERVLEAESEGEEPSRRADRDIQEAWTQWRTEMAEHARTVSDARAALNEARVVAEGSTFSPAEPIDVTLYEGEIASFTVRILAQVRTPDEQDVEQTLEVTLEQAQLTGDDGTPLNGRWIITAVDEVG
jgi:hypothetical protein